MYGVGARLTEDVAQKRLNQVSGHLAGSKSAIAPTEGDAGSAGRANILKKSPDDVCIPHLSPSLHTIINTS